MNGLVCLGLSHRTAPVELRERIGALGFGAENCPAVLEHAVLQTCYRVELYARLTSNADEARDELIREFSSAHGVERELLLAHLYVHVDEDVARHLCRVATGLDSLVLGEAEILGQVGAGFEVGQAAGTVGPGLTLLFRTAISAGRRARSETAIGVRPATASSMALALGEGLLGDLREKDVLVVGAGQIGLQALKAVTGRGVTRVAVANRTGARAQEVAGHFEATAHDFDHLVGALAAADLAITTTASELPVITADHVRAAMSRRPERPLVIVDLAVPADVERDAGGVEGVRLFDVDDLRAGLDDAMASRLREVPKVEAIVEDEVGKFARRNRELEVEPVVSALRKQAESIRSRELARALKDLGDVDPAVAARMEHLSRTLVKKLLHDPTVRLRARAVEGDPAEVADTVRELFGISAP
jgi:glutamyl-tRNA reductase